MAAGLEHGGSHGTGAALALGAGHVHGFKIVVRIAYFLKQVPHPVEIEIGVVVADDAEPLVVRKRGEESHRLGVGTDAVGMMLAVFAVAVGR